MDNNSKKGKNSYLVPAAILVAAVIIAGAVIYSLKAKPANNNLPSGNQQGPAAAQNPSVDIANIDLSNEPFIGDANAPVVMAYWFDYQCPYCKRFEDTTMPTLVSDYVDSGKLRIVFKDFQFLGSDSQDAALVANAVWDLYPQHFYDWLKAMFNAQDAENSGFGNMNSIISMMKTNLPEIDTNKIQQQIQEKKSAYQQEIDADKSEAAKIGITGTPAFVVGKQLIVGAQPTTTFTQAIDAALNK